MVSSFRNKQERDAKCKWDMQEGFGRQSPSRSYVWKPQIEKKIQRADNQQESANRTILNDKGLDG